MIDEKARKSKPPTLVDIHHPAFRKGYQEGRASALQEQAIVSDKDLVDFLQLVFDDRKLNKPDEQEDNLYYSVGHILGEVSMHVIPYQPYEECVERP